MFFLKKLYFIKKIYPQFYENLDMAHKGDSAVVFMDVISEVLTIMVIINFEVVIFKKRIDSPLVIDRFSFSPEIKEPTNELYDLIIKTKHNASSVKNHNFIETFGEMLGRVKVLYKIYAEQQHTIWNEVFSLDTNFFVSNGEIQLPVGENKWVD